jgi:hypothetical protein
MRTLSKSKLLAYRQCPKRLWLEVYRRDLSTDAIGVSAGFTAGQTVGAVARKIYDPDASATLVDVAVLGVGGAAKRTAELLPLARPIFEAGFVGGTASAFADVLLPMEADDERTWRMLEVKSATTVKEYHRDDAAIQGSWSVRRGCRCSRSPSLMSIRHGHIRVEKIIGVCFWRRI